MDLISMRRDPGWWRKIVITAALVGASVLLASAAAGAPTVINGAAHVTQRAERLDDVPAGSANKVRRVSNITHPDLAGTFWVQATVQNPSTCHGGGFTGTFAITLTMAPGLDAYGRAEVFLLDYWDGGGAFGTPARHPRLQVGGPVVFAHGDRPYEIVEFAAGDGRDNRTMHVEIRWYDYFDRSTLLATQRFDHRIVCGTD